ncbi:MAG: hypothetical protein EHM93_12265 [Bacteroidales bacterium]|nr:MAG: hypothetical protein EHM93_12265 [Bacteroidales bacterium]
MKKLQLTALLFVFSFILQAQAPQGFSYQAVIRNGSGAPIVDQFVGVEITLQNTLEAVLYTETHRPRTSAQGVISITIGEGTVVGTNTFASIPWSTGDVLVKVRIDPAGGTAYAQVGELTELKSVPYALYANPKEITSSPSADPNAPIFEVKNSLGQVVFGVYQGGVRVNVEDVAKSAKGGFAVGGLSGSTKAGSTEFLRITPDSARIYINDAITPKGAKGGFAVGGLSGSTKGKAAEFLRITPDSARIYINDSNTKGAKGGFAVGGLSGSTKAPSGNFLDLTPDNYFIGQEAGKSITTGLYNSFMGFEAGKSNKTGSNNVYLGYQTGSLNGTGENNVFIGNSSGFNSNGGYSNIFIGHHAGLNSTSTTHSTFIGTDVAYNMNGDDNIVIGDQAGRNNYVSNYETFGAVVIGVDAGRNITGSGNLILGVGAGSKWNGTTERNNNVFIGSSAGGGGLNTLSDNNVCIGYQAGWEKTGSNKLYISNSDINNLIYGEFDNQRVAINATNPTQTLDVNGNARFRSIGSAAGGLALYRLADGTLTTSVSDIRLKENINSLTSSLSKVLQLRGVSFTWKKEPQMGLKIGFIAQEVEKVFPELVFTNEVDGFKGVNYAEMTAVLVEAIKELQKQNQLLQEKVKEIDAIKAELESIKAKQKK